MRWCETNDGRWAVGWRGWAPAGSLVLLLLAAAATDAAAQARRTDPAELRCPTLLGTGVTTGREYCDVLIQQSPDQGAIIVVPPHRGTATILLDLHNRHTYSAEEVRLGRGYAEYTALVQFVAVDGRVLKQAAVRNEVWTEADLLDRVSGGAGPTGLKAVAPTGTERVSFSVPPDVTEIAVLGLQLDVVRADRRDTFSAPGRPVAVISDVRVEYRPRR